MPFISSGEARKCIFHEKYAFVASLDETNGIFIPKFECPLCNIEVRTEYQCIQDTWADVK